MTFLTKSTEKSKDSYKILYLPNSDVVQETQNRRRTDTFFLIIFVASIALLLPLVIYTFSYSDINRLKGYDRCGNICGQNNTKYDQWDCTGQDTTIYPVLTYDGRCLENYADNRVYEVSSMYGQAVFETIYLNIWKVVLVSFVPLALCLILVVLFRYAPAVTAWSILIGFWLSFPFLGLLYLCTYFLWGSVFVTIYCIISILILCLYILINLNYIKLAAPLLKEATRPLFEVKMMSFVPAGALPVLIVIVLIYASVNFHIMTSGKLTEIYAGELDYVPDNVMLATKIISCLMAIWAMMVVLGAQYTTVSGVVAQWYTIKNLDNLDDAVSSNIRTTIHYHLGTAALVPVMMTIMFVPRLILQFFAIFSALKQKTDSWLRCLDGFFTNNSYIVTAIHGTSFIQSGKKAAYLFRHSIGDTRDLNSFANSLIRMAQILVIFISTLTASITLQCNYMCNIHFYYIEFAVGCVCAYSILGTLKISTNTLFFCATQELLRNEEADLPYNMAMQKFVKGSNKLFLQKVQSVPPSNIVKSVYIKLFLFIFVAISVVAITVAYFI